MLAVPLTHLLLIRGLEEYSADPQDSPSLAIAAPAFALAAFGAVLACCCAGETGISNTARTNRTGCGLRNMRGL
jgi:hypothetical protein